MKSETQERRTIQRKSPSESHKTLGCFKNPDMDSKAQAEDLRKKAERISQLTFSNGLSSATIKLAYSSVYLPAIQYPLNILTCPRRTLDSVQAKATRRILAGMGFNPNMPRIFAHAPKQIGGGGSACKDSTRLKASRTKH